jgi:hypothetical protein
MVSIIYDELKINWKLICQMKYALGNKEMGMFGPINNLILTRNSQLIFFIECV